MSISMPSERRRVLLTSEAEADLRSLREQDESLLTEALRTLKRVADRQLEPRRLGYQGKTGDLGDCGKLYFGASRGSDSHRIVVREVEQVFEVIEVVAVDARERDLAYLLAALRLERIDDVVRQADTARIVRRLRTRSQRD